ncbi:MAG: tetratricopeptide repeat protein [Candidatus Paceibacterota bacterium]
MENILQKIVKGSIYLLTFLLPIFWLPFTFEVFEFNKEYLLFFVAIIGFFAWFAKMIFYDKEVRFKKSPINLLVLVFLFVAILSAIFSVDKNSSLFGFYGRFSNGLIPLLSLMMFYFLVINNISTDKAVKEKQFVNLNGIINTFLASTVFIILTAFFSIFGLWSGISNFTAQTLHFGLPSFMLLWTFNPVSGSLEGLAVFLSVVVVLLTGLLMTAKENQKGKVFLTVCSLLLIASLALMMIIGFKAAWIILLVTLVLFSGIAIWKRFFTENVNKLDIPIVLIIISIVFLFSNFVNDKYFSYLPKEQVLSQGISWQTTFKASVENVKSGFLGSGIGTYHYDFSKFKPAQFNQSLLWQIRYDRPASHISEVLGTMGFLGLISYLALLGIFGLIAYFVLSKPDAKKHLPLLMTFVALVIGQFVYYQNITLAFAFWLFLALLVSSFQGQRSEEISFRFKETPEIGLVFNIFLIVIGLALIVCFWFAKDFYYADVLFARFQNIQQTEGAVTLNPSMAQYRIVLAKAYLQEALNEAVKPIAQRDTKKILSAVTQSINQAKSATDLSPSNVATQETMGAVYRDVRLLTTGDLAESLLGWGIKTFEVAIKLEPTNPVLYTELGKLYVIKNDSQKAIELFEKAIELKPDYTEALTQDMAIYEKEQKPEALINKLEEFSSKYPSNIEMLFQLGRIYYNDGQISKAISQFNKVLELSPNHSNALYSLGIAYLRQGKTQEAAAAFQRVLELNPGNQDVINRLKELGY